MKVSKMVYNCVFNILVAVIMSAIMSLVLTIVNAGIIPGFMGIWLKTFLVSTLLAIPVTFVSIPLVSKLLRFLEIR